MQERKSTLRHILENIIQGIFGLLPAVAIVVIIMWLYTKVGIFIDYFFKIIGFEPENYKFLWAILVIGVIVLLLYFVGLLVETKLANIFQKYFKKIPGYTTIKDVVNIFNSSKKGDTKVLIVLIKGFGSTGYNVGLMYSTKESVIKNHYTVTLTSSPIPNGGYMFEMHKDNIYVIEKATFDDNLQYLLAMGVKSLKDIIKIEAKTIDEFTPLSKWLENNNKLVNK